MNSTRILIPLMFFLAGTVLHAQYSNEAFEQKRAGELYDERGFLQNKAITVDGKLVVSNSNGNVSYSYPLTAWKESGYNFSASLNYCGSVAFTTFGEYDHENMESPYSAWDRFTQNRPVWLLGVNGFAVQAVSFAASFHAHPDWITGRYENESITSFDDEDFVWAIDGYDVCNRMQDFAAGSFEEEQGAKPYRYRDVIRLLRADGSVLELLNVSYEQSGAGGSDVWGVSGHLYSGYYVVNEANAQGYAWVEYQDTSDLPFYLNDFLPDAPRYRPRIVHYYPGDGLEYIFKEWFNPFGMQDLLDAGLQFGGAKANPTIFYLMEIRSAGKHLLNFYYSRHREVDYGFDQGYYPVYDSTKGRALLTGFGESTVSYGDGWMAVKTDGRTTVVRFDTVSFSGNANPSQSFPLATMGYLGSVSQAVAEFPLDEDGQYASWLGYVTSITDPEGRETVFDYEQYERRHWDFGFPRGDVTVTLKNYRLNEIIEPTAKYAIKYHNRGGGYESFDVDGLDTLTVRQGYVGDYPYAFSNSAWEVEKRTLAGGLLTTDSYDFIFGSAPMETVPTGASVVTEDNLSGRSTTTNYHYTRHKLPRGIQLTPDKYYTALDKVETFGYVNSVKTDSTVQTTSYTNPAPYLWLPSSQRQVAGAAVQAYTDFTYGLDTVRRYGDDDTLIKYHGMEVGTTVSYTIDPLGRTHRVDSTIYLNIPEFDTSFTRIIAVLDKFAMARNFLYYRDTLHHVDFVNAQYVDVYFDPRILVVKYYDTLSLNSYKLPPYFGLVAETSTYDGNGNYLRGKKNVYCQQGDCDAGTSALTWFEGLNLIGALISDTIYGRNRAMIPGARIFYDRTERGMPDYVQNSVGARTRNYYDYRHPGIDTSEQPTGLMLANDDVAYEQGLRNSTYYAFRHELPQSTRTEVRRYDPGLSILTDTLTTLYELGRFGQTTRTVDPNGWLSEYTYDYNGRLDYAWLPYDFQSPDSLYFIDYHGLEEITGYGWASWISYQDTSDCLPFRDPEYARTANPFGGSDNLFIDRPIVTAPGCATGGSVTEEKGESTQALSTSDIPYEYRDSATGHLSFTLPNAYGHQIIDIDSAFIELYASTVVGSCVTVKMTMPEYTTFSQTWLLNCESLPYDPGGGGTQSGTSGGGTGKGPSTLSGPDTVNGQFLLRVNLAGYLDSLVDDDRLLLTLATTTINGKVEFINGFESQDGLRPRLLLYLHEQKRNRLSDYTLHYEHNDTTLTSTVTAKIDDSLHTANRDVGGVAALGEARRTATTHYFGADYRLLKSKTPIGPLDSPVRYDSVGAEYDGLGLTAKARDQLGDTVVTVYDGMGRADTTWNQDGTFTTIEYYYCTYDPDPNPEFDTIYPFSCFDFAPSQQDFYGSVTAKVSTNELGKKFVEYYDAFGQLRRQVADSGGLHLITQYEYDILGRLKTVTNPAGDETEYWYDDFGRIRYKQQPDLGTISYAYDNLGNVRFVQTEEQYEEDRITFNEYDDLNRLGIVGEADFFDHAPSIGESIIGGGVTGERPDPEKMGTLRRVQSVPTDDTIDLYRITDDLDPNILHDDTISAILTANKTLWMALNTYGNALPIFWDELDSIPEDCEDMNQAVPDAVGPFLKHAATAYEPVAEISDYDDFENLAKHPENVRIAINYDRLPYSAGAAWETFPSIAEWNALAPHDSVRNLKGREAAVAYREHGGEAFHYSVLSYDERGRPEALLRYTENLGFDAVYYQYNSMNQVIAVTVADPFRQFTTWYGYDDNGRIDSVWTKLGGVGTGLSSIDPSCPATPLSRPDDAEVTYVYTKTGQVDTMAYPAVSVVVDYHYSPRKWLDTLIATKGGVDLFKQELTFDAAGRITRQMSSHGGGSAYRQDYGYDAINQLTNWVKKPPGQQQTSENYAYDEVGNRESITYSGAGATPPLPQLVYDLGRGSGPGVGPNQMLKSQDWVGTTAGDYTEYTYDPDGSMNSRKRYDATSTLLMEERFGYSSWRGLSWKYEREDPNIPVGPNIWEYRYRYNAMGEREQKREWLNPSGDGTAPGYGWTYYLLGGGKEQLSVWQGMQTSESGFCEDTGTGSEVYLYPTEYLTYGIEYPGIREDIPRLRLLPNGEVEYRITDHLASLRVTVDGTGAVIDTFDYRPFGGILSSGGEARQGFNSREKDTEHGLFNNGVRKLDDEEGRFTSIDPLWEKFRAWSPYQYGYNNPMGVTDPSGMQGNSIKETLENVAAGVVKGAVETANSISNLQLSQNGADFIKSFEDLRLDPYYLKEDGQTTIGWGHYLHDGRPSPNDKSITLAEAEAFFKSDVSQAVDEVKSGLTRAPTQAQFDAMVSFAFNVVGDFTKTNLLAKFNAGDVKGAALEFDVVKGTESKSEDFGLVRRRWGEIQIFLQGDYSYGGKRPNHEFPATFEDVRSKIIKL